MLQNFQRYFRFYLAFFLFGILFIGVRWSSDSAAIPAVEPITGLAPAGPAGPQQGVATR